ncbi:MAG: sigma-70 family RNA polymerase sigma factor [Bacillota bacterium]
MDELKLIRGVLAYMFGSLSSAMKVAERCHMSIEDFEQVGRIAIWKASEKFVAKDDNSFDSYAFGVIRFDIMKEVRRKGNFITIPHSADFKKNAKSVSSLNVKADPESNDELQELIPGESFDEDTILNRIVIDQKIRSLPKRERYIVAGLLKGKSQKDIGEEIGFSQMQISRLYRQAVDQLKEEVV